MSKSDELRKKYSKVTATTFNKFVIADFTNTKKYLEFYLKTWQNKSVSGVGPKNTNELIDLVRTFDSNLHYIEIKDIYNSNYLDFNFFRHVVLDSEMVKNEKTFVREEHAITLIETDELLFIHPKTFRASLKYGTNTKWCTSGKNYEQTFNRYAKEGLLVYLIDKTDKIQAPYNKVAFYLDYHESPLAGDLDLYNSIDKIVSDLHMIRNGWDEDVLFQVFSSYRFFFSKIRKFKESRDFIERINGLFDLIDFEKLSEHIQILEKEKNADFLKSFKNNVMDITDKLKTIKDEYRETKN